jgi:hypothetical protein
MTKFNFYKLNQMKSMVMLQKIKVWGLIKCLIVGIQD